MPLHGEGYRPALGGAVIAADLFCFLSGHVLLWWRGTYQPLHSMNPILLGTTLYHFLPTLFWVGLREILGSEALGITCGTLVYLTNVCLLAFTVPWIVFAYRLYLVSDFEKRKIAFALAELKAGHATGAGGAIVPGHHHKTSSVTAAAAASATSTVELVKRHTTRRMLLLIAVLFVVPMALVPVYLAVDRSVSGYDGRGSADGLGMGGAGEYGGRAIGWGDYVGCAYWSRMAIPFALTSTWVIGAGTRVVYLLWKHKVNDGWHMREQLSVLLAYCLLIEGAYFAVNIASPTINVDVFDTGLVGHAVGYVTYAHMVLWPALQTWRMAQPLSYDAHRTHSSQRTHGTSNGGNGSQTSRRLKRSKHTQRYLFGGPEGGPASPTHQKPTVNTGAFGGGGGNSDGSSSNGGPRAGGTALATTTPRSRENKPPALTIATGMGGGMGIGGPMTARSGLSGATTARTISVGAAGSNAAGAMASHKDLTARPLMRVLLDPNGYDELLSYAESEFAAENIIFWRACDEYRADPSIDAAVRLYRMFISDSAALQVNISYKVYAHIHGTLRPFLLGDQPIPPHVPGAWAHAHPSLQPPQPVPAASTGDALALSVAPSIDAAAAAGGPTTAMAHPAALKYRASHTATASSTSPGLTATMSGPVPRSASPAAGAGGFGIGPTPLSLPPAAAATPIITTHTVGTGGGPRQSPSAKGVLTRRTSGNSPRAGGVPDLRLDVGAGGGGPLDTTAGTTGGSIADAVVTARAQLSKTPKRSSLKVTIPLTPRGAVHAGSVSPGGHAAVAAAPPSPTSPAQQPLSGGTPMHAAGATGMGGHHRRMTSGGATVGALFVQPSAVGAMGSSSSPHHGLSGSHSPHTPAAITVHVMGGGTHGLHRGFTLSAVGPSLLGLPQAFPAAPGSPSARTSASGGSTPLAGGGSGTGSGANSAMTTARTVGAATPVAATAAGPATEPTERDYAVLYDAAQREVFVMTESDSFSRFKKTARAQALSHLWADLPPTPGTKRHGAASATGSATARQAFVFPIPPPAVGAGTAAPTVAAEPKR